MKNNKSKKNLIIGCSVGAVVCIVTAIVVFMLVRGGEKTVSCTKKESVMGIKAESKYDIKVTSGKMLGGNALMKVDIASMSDIYKKNESMMVDSLVNTMKSQCKDDCVIKHEHVPGESLTITMEFGEKGIKNVIRTYGNIEAASAQEVADVVRKAQENAGMTCEQH